ncbi:CCA tRNA nucleotidyltransferase 1, mitochondrial isoform X2 [Drosophila sulfurigaster albostrigata]|uniref:CCA tRNA nucleotidyltransferase 1, mitochondrial isoform X2 n=1 Tax=Drosophila sulfurigaster albostrigata TaxID=89887 RepID=UPI002D2198E8|nr:CCA tRNA nucleotidyltransferase 1, mitochondrial isoform X2 [Drosophila sulfurigaster albostrigata]
MHGLRCITKILTSPRASASAVGNFHLHIRLLTTFPSRMPSPPKIAKPSQESELLEDIVKQLGKPPRMRENPAFTKVDSAEFHSIFTPELEELVALFKKYDYELRIAGGAVRDILMSIKPKDVDLATTATPEQMKEMFTKEEVRMINAKGEKHGTITPRINNKENFEVTTLRIDVRTDGRHADVMFTTDWQLDANRRDLTINSMFLGFDGTVYDYFYGYDDLQKRRIVFVGDANVRIKEDYLRILRYFRFYGRIVPVADTHDAVTLAAIKANAEGLARISGERIWAELQKIVAGNFGYELVLEMYKCDLTAHCGLPAEPDLTEFKRLCSDLKHFEQPHYPILYLIGLLNSSEDAIKMHERLKLSAHERDLALFITQQRQRVDVEYVCLRDYQKLCLQPYAKRDFVEQLLKYTNKLELYNQLKAWETPNFPINGNTLKSHGLVGKIVGQVIAELRLLWTNSDFKLTADELLEKLPTILELLQKSPPGTPNKKPRSHDVDAN